LIGMAALCWAIWIFRNDLVFNKSRYIYILQVIFRGVFWIRSWSILSNEEGRRVLKFGCLKLETVALAFFHGSGWNTFKRIES
jgi:4-hydroxybenzoate polyprenyltransferase